MLSNTGSSSDEDDAQEESLSISGGVPADIRGTGLRATERLRRLGIAENKYCRCVHVVLAATVNIDVVLVVP